jgi:hypothetical protein
MHTPGIERIACPNANPAAKTSAELISEYEKDGPENW